MKRHLDFCESRMEFVFAAAQVVAEAAAAAVAERGRFLMALSGGGTPSPLYDELSRGEFRIPWAATHVFFSDERAVPPEDERSNYRMAVDILLSKVPLPEGNVHRIPGELGAVAAADAAERDVRGLTGVAAPGMPVFDLVLLGMGTDGHTASLFPGSAALSETDRCFVAAAAPGLDPRVERVTMTLPCIRAARRVAVLTGAKGKREALEAALAGCKEGDETLPVARISASEHLFWIIRP